MFQDRTLIIQELLKLYEIREYWNQEPSPTIVTDKASAEKSRRLLDEEILELHFLL